MTASRVGTLRVGLTCNVSRSQKPFPPTSIFSAPDYLLPTAVQVELVYGLLTRGELCLSSYLILTTYPAA